MGRRFTSITGKEYIMAIRRLPCPTGGKDAYDKVCEYQVKQEVLNAFGGIDDSASNWTRVSRLYCNLKTGNGTEVYRAKQVDSDTDAVVTMAWNSRTDLFTASGRFVIKGKVYNILYAVNENEDDEKMIFGCRRVV